MKQSSKPYGIAKPHIRKSDLIGRGFVAFWFKFNGHYVERTPLRGYGHRMWAAYQQLTLNPERGYVW